MAFLQKGSTPELLVTWYDTSFDPTNSLVRVNCAVSTFSSQPFFSGATSLISQVSTASTSPAGQIVPWGDQLAQWTDYQGIGVDVGSQSFLAAWGGDGRLVNSTANGPAGVWTARITPQ